MAIFADQLAGSRSDKTRARREVLPGSTGLARHERIESAERHGELRTRPQAAAAASEFLEAGVSRARLASDPGVRVWVSAPAFVHVGR